MKRTILAVVLTVPLTAMGAANEISVEQRNSSNTAWVQKIPTNPPGTNHGLFFIDGVNKLLKWVTPIGMTYDNVNNTLTATGTKSDWSLASGPGSILNKPTIPAAQVQTDWNAVSGMGALLNKPTFATVATSGAYNDLSGRPVLSVVATSGLYSDLSGRPTLALVATSGDYNDLTNKPSIPATQVNADWSAGSGVAQILNKPSLAAVATSGAYADLSGLPSLFDGTWASLSGKPSTFAPSAHTHAATDIVSGTLADARIPSLAISKTTGLQTALDAKFPIPAGATGQYVRGDGSLATFPTIPGAYAIGVPTTRSVALATAVQCSNAAQPCLFTFTLSSTSSISLGGTSNNEGQIVLGATNAVASGTGTVTAVYRNVLGGTLVVGLNLTSQQANTYTVPVPAGYYVAVRQTAGSGLTVVSAYDQQTN